MKSTEKLLLAGLIVLVITNAVTYSNVKRIKGEISQLRSETSGIFSRISGIESNISNTMQTISRENQWIYEQGFEITDISEDFTNATISVRWGFRNLDKDSEVFISYGEKDSSTGSVSKWTELPAVSTGVLSYRNEITLPAKANYKFKIVARNSAGTKSGELADVDLLGFMQNRMHINIMPSTRDKNGVSYNLSIQNEFKFLYSMPFDREKIDINRMKIKNVKINIYFDNQLVRDFYVYQDGKALPGYEIRYHDNRGEIETFDFNHDLKLENDMNKGIRFEAIVEDYLGNTYKQSQEM